MSTHKVVVRPGDVVRIVSATSTMIVKVDADGVPDVHTTTRPALAAAASEVVSAMKVVRPDPQRLAYAFWQYGCAVFCDQQEKFGMTREKAAEWYRKLSPPPPAPWLTAANREET